MNDNNWEGKRTGSSLFHILSRAWGKGVRIGEAKVAEEKEKWSGEQSSVAEPEQQHFGED
jgi:hypothetical protein